MGSEIPCSALAAESFFRRHPPKDAVLEKDGFWPRLKEESIEVGDRQKEIINLLFEGKLTTEKWAKLAKTSHDTALRDIQDLIEKGVLKQDKAGGSTAYVLLHERAA